MTMRSAGAAPPADAGPSASDKTELLLGALLQADRDAAAALPAPQAAGISAIDATGPAAPAAAVDHSSSPAATATGRRREGIGLQQSETKPTAASTATAAAVDVDLSSRPGGSSHGSDAAPPAQAQALTRRRRGSGSQAVGMRAARPLQAPLAQRLPVRPDDIFAAFAAGLGLVPDPDPESASRDLTEVDVGAAAGDVASADSAGSMNPEAMVEGVAGGMSTYGIPLTHSSAAAAIEVADAARGGR